MRNYKHTPELAGTLTAYHFPSTLVSLWMGDDDVEEGLEAGLEGYVTFNNAFYQIEGDWTVVYTEHLGYHVYRTVGILQATGQKGPEQLTKSVQDMLDHPLEKV